VGRKKSDICTPKTDGAAENGGKVEGKKVKRASLAAGDGGV